MLSDVNYVAGFQFNYQNIRYNWIKKKNLEMKSILQYYFLFINHYTTVDPWN